MGEATKQNLPLGGTWQDNVGSLVKGGIGSIPIVGSILGEVFGLIIPNQRLNRIESYLKHLSAKLDVSEPEALAAKLGDPDAVDLLEEGLWQAARALSEERKQQIAQLVATGINGDEKARIESKRLLDLLERIDDDQIVILASYTNKLGSDAEWREKHENILRPVAAFMGAEQSTIDQSTLFELARAQLIALGLLRTTFKTPKKGEMPEFDPKTGMIKAGTKTVSPLGRLLLNRIGVLPVGEF